MKCKICGDKEYLYDLCSAANMFGMEALEEEEQACLESGICCECRDNGFSKEDCYV